MTFRIKRFERTCALAEVAGTGVGLTAMEMRSMLNEIESGYLAAETNREMLSQMDKLLVENALLKDVIAENGMDLSLLERKDHGSTE